MVSINAKPPPECGCNTSTDYFDNVTIHYCSMHKAAPEMLADLEMIANDQGSSVWELMRRARAVVRYAKGEENEWQRKERERGPPSDGEIEAAENYR